MPGWGQRIGEPIATLLSRPDEVMLEMGASGELLVARLRVVVAALLLLLPLANALSGGTIDETLIGLAGAVAVNVVAHIWLVLAKRHRQHAWLPFATSAWDVTAATLVLALLALHQLPSGLNSLIVWCGYLLAIMLTALRSDGRVSVFTGALAIVQYGSLAATVFFVAQSPEHLVSSEYGTVTVSNQLQRLLILAMFTLITTVVVYRMQRLVELSGTDGLTGLPNRTWLHQRMPRLLESVRNDGGSLTLALIDLDRFRHINEDAGHRAGDAALRQTVDLMREQLEHDEWLVRIGGQEFVLLQCKPMGTAWEHLDAVRRAIAGRGFVSEHGADPLPLTFSAGLASYPHEAADLSGLLQRADQRLKQAKREGRNRVVARDA